MCLQCVLPLWSCYIFLIAILDFIVFVLVPMVVVVVGGGGVDDDDGRLLLLRM